MCPRFVASLHLERRVVLWLSGRAGVAMDEHKPMQRPVLPFSFFAPRVIPAVVAPILDPSDQIERAVAS